MRPWGLDGLGARDAEKVELGNACLRSALRVIHAFHKAGRPWILENPTGSRMWCVPELMKLRGDRQCLVIDTDFCGFGRPWRKRTRFLIGNIPATDCSRMQRFCRTHGVCAFTGRPHFVLKGLAPGGVPWTRVAMHYPPELCKAIAFALTAPLRAVALGV